MLENHADLSQKVRELEAKLSRAEYEKRRWRSIFMELPACVAITRGKDHILEFANSAWEKASGVNNVEGQRLGEAPPELERQGIIDLANKIYREGKPFANNEFPAEVDLPDGKVKTQFYNGAIVPLKDQDGSVEGLINFQYDVTDLIEGKKQNDFVNEKLALAVEASKLNLWEFDATTQKMSWKSENTFEVFGYKTPPPKWEFDDFIAHVHPEDRHVIETTARGAYETNMTQFDYEFRIIWPDKSVHWMISKGKVVRDENKKPIKFVGATMDVTAHKEAEIKLKQLKEAAEAANVAKTQFLANMSHEIRTPLAAIMGFSELMANPNLNSERRAYFAETIDRNGKALVKLVDDILDISKIEAGQVRIFKAPFELNEFINEIVQINQFAAQTKGITLSVRQNKTDGIIETDRGRLRQIILNVLGNAVKFTEKGTVHLEVSLEKDLSPARLSFVVRDTGIGISKEGQEILFQFFSQADGSSTRSFGGTGLGLAISRRLAQALGGDVTLIKSQPNQGSEFKIEVAVSTINQTIEKPHVTEKTLGGGRLTGLRILLAEDTPDMQTLMTMYLTGEGAQVEVVGNGAHVLATAIKKNFDIGLIDIQMPGLDGYSIFETLRRNGITIPLVAVTAHALNFEKEKCLNYGFNGYLTKPVNFELLTNTIRDVSAGN